MRAIESAATAFASVAIVSAFALPARAQSTVVSVTDSGNAIAPIEIFATPPTPPPRPAVNHGTYFPSMGGPTGETVVRITSLRGAAAIAFVPASARVPREYETHYSCRTPCEVTLPHGWYQILVDNEVGRLRRFVEVRHDPHFFVTPRESRALATGLLVPGILTGFAGFVLLIDATITTTSPFYTGNPAAIWLATGALFIGGAAFTIGGGYFMHDTGGAIRTHPDRDPIPRMRNPVAVIVPTTNGALAVATVRF
jgi:hypothetical protein